MKPTTPTVLIGYFDIVMFLLLLAFNLLVWKFDFLKSLNCGILLIFSVVLFIIIPLIASFFEAHLVHSTYEMVDGFNLLYIWLKWPIYWLVGIIELILLRLILLNKKEKYGAK